MQTFMLLMHLATYPGQAPDTYVLELNLTAEQCVLAQRSYYANLNPNAFFVCEPELSQSEIQAQHDNAGE